eukprot:14395-Eustigmatos_ZCMA.PRE.1
MYVLSAASAAKKDGGGEAMKSRLSGCSAGGSGPGSRSVHDSRKHCTVVHVGRNCREKAADDHA